MFSKKDEVTVEIGCEFLGSYTGSEAEMVIIYINKLKKCRSLYCLYMRRQGD